MGATDRAGVGHRERPGVYRPPFGDNAKYFRNDVAGATHNHRVADADAALALDLVSIVQGRVGHRDAADEDGLQPGDRRQRAGTANLDVDRLDHG